MPLTLLWTILSMVFPVCLSLENQEVYCSYPLFCILFHEDKYSDPEKKTDCKQYQKQQAGTHFNSGTFCCTLKLLLSLLLFTLACSQNTDKFPTGDMRKIWLAAIYMTKYYMCKDESMLLTRTFHTGSSKESQYSLPDPNIWETKQLKNILTFFYNGSSWNSHSATNCYWWNKNCSCKAL